MNEQSSLPRRLEIYCVGSKSTPHERVTVARMTPAADADGTLWVAHPASVKQFLHGDVHVPDSPRALFGLPIDRHGPLRLRYRLRCAGCGYTLVRGHKVLEPVMGKLVDHGVAEVELANLSGVAAKVAE